MLKKGSKMIDENNTESVKMKAIEISDSEFESLVVKSDIPVLIDWWAPWCGPCRMVMPAMNKLAEEYAGKAAIVKINCDQHANFAMSQNVNALPTVTVWKNGSEVSRIVGLRSISDYRKAIDSVL